MQIGHPLRTDGLGRIASVNEDEHVRDLIEQVLFTSPGERVNRPTFGTGILQFVFAPNSEEVAGTLQFLIEGALTQWLGDLIEAVNKSYASPFKFDYQFDAAGHPEQYYCRSDHYEYARYGIPITFFTTAGHSDYHQLTDEPQYINYPHLARVASFVADIASHIANLDHRILVDKAKPDPKGECKQ
jgi:hypothetical protein